MKFTNPVELRNYLRAKGLRPKDYLGQNFLIDEDVLSQIIKAAEIKPDDVVLEVGPGLGVLSGELVTKAKEVWAVEKDRNMANILRSEFKKNEKFKLFNEDILRFNLLQIKGDYKVVANIPYYITSKLLQNFLESSNPPKLLVLMVQKEVGERVIASAGELSILGISVQIYADAEIAESVSKNSFWPVPKVDSVILKITPRNKYPEIKDKKLFFRIVKVAFAGKRKQIHNSLMNGLKLPKETIMEKLIEAGIDPSTRPQDIKIEDWININNVFQK